MPIRNLRYFQIILISELEFIDQFVTSSPGNILDLHKGQVILPSSTDSMWIVERMTTVR